MKILDALDQGAIVADLKAADKQSVLEELADVLTEVAGVNREELLRVLWDREQLGSTGIGDGIAIPHGKLSSLASPLIGLGRSRKGVDFDSLDGRPAFLFFLLLAPENSAGLHLKLLARVSGLLKKTKLRQQLLDAANQQEIYEVIEREEKGFF